MTTTPSVAHWSTHEIEAEFKRLEALFKGKLEGNDGVANQRVTRSPGAVFSTDILDCYLCTYCGNCSNCVKCTHCHFCDFLYDSRYCQKSSYSSGSSYLLLSSYCHDCVFCFACVGLVGKEFHILNKAYSRQTYFQLLPKLKSRFGLV